MPLSRPSLYTFLFACFTFLSCGGGVSGENGNDPFGSENSDTSTELKLGYFDQNNQFIEGEIALAANDNGISEVSAGGSIGLSVVVNQDNQRVQSATSVTFTSACVTATDATLETNVSTVNGEASNTFMDQGCGGASGISDEIVA